MLGWSQGFRGEREPSLGPSPAPKGVLPRGLAVAGTQEEDLIWGEVKAWDGVPEEEWSTRPQKATSVSVWDTFLHRL